MKLSIKRIGLLTVLIVNALSADDLQNQMQALKSEMEQVKPILDQKLAVAEKDYADWDKKSKEAVDQRSKTAQEKGINYWELSPTDKEYAGFEALLKNVEEASKNVETAEGFRNGLRVVKDTLNQLIYRLATPRPNLDKISWKTGFVNPFAAEMLKLQHGKETQEEVASHDTSGGFLGGAKARGIVEALELGLGYLKPLLAKAQSIVQ